MKVISVFVIIIGLAICILLHSCDRESYTKPKVLTKDIIWISQFVATSGGNVIDTGGLKISERGVCWDVMSNPIKTDNKTLETGGSGEYISYLSGLSPNTTYYVRAYASNSVGTAYGDELSFKSLPELATVTTSPVINITSNSATCGGTITSDGGVGISARGICWSWSNSYPTISDNINIDGSGSGTFISNLIDLTPHTNYYVRAYATNSSGTAYGASLSFLLPHEGSNTDIIFNPAITYDTLQDVDGNIYKTVQIGQQTWMSENLKTTKYNDGSPILLMTSTTPTGTPAYCFYNDDDNNKNIYGALYNWYTISSGKLCPIGWHVPSDEEWTSLTSYLGGPANAGDKVKETGTIHWLGPNNWTTNMTGFTALPGGFASGNLTFGYIEGTGTWWSSTERQTSTAESRDLFYLDSEFHSSHADKWFGMSVRCVKDN